MDVTKMLFSQLQMKHCLQMGQTQCIKFLENFPKSGILGFEQEFKKQIAGIFHGIEHMI